MQKTHVPCGILWDLYPTLCTGHKITMGSVVAVLNEVKDLNAVADAMGMPDELNRDIFTDSAKREETVGRVSTFWLQGNPSWRQLRGILQSCDEYKALELNNKWNFITMKVCTLSLHILEYM